MKRLRRLLISLMITALMAAGMPMTAFAKPDWPSDTGIESEAGIVMDADSGAVLFGQNIHVQKAPASITKILTALVVIENSSLDDTITFSHDAVYNVEDGSGNKNAIEEGDTLSVRDCLYLLLMRSSNQAANALAEHVGGSRDGFVKMMNEKTAELGCENSHFANPSGLNDDTQLTSVYDMALIASAAYKNDTLLTISKDKSYRLPATKNNPDGSTTKTETRKDGSVTQTTTAKDGSVSKTETKKDGSSVTENKAADGSTGTIKTDKNGKTEMNAKVSAKAVENAKKSGEPVKAPVEVEAARNSNAAPTVKVELPGNAGKTEVEIPVSNANAGTVAVLVRPDGTEEILKDSIPTENGIRLKLDGGATVKIVDNSKDFIDTRNHWAREEIDFVSARELVNGMSDTIYAPNASATRAQLWTILARQNDTDLSGGANWYEKAQLWSKDKGISDGTEPNAAINRAQMVTMLWRTMGQPAATDKVSFADVPAGSYYAQAVAWAVENGITGGIGGGLFGSGNNCTRGQIVAFLWRDMAE